MENFKMPGVEPEKKKDEEGITRRSFLGKAAKIGAAFLGAGAIGACDRIIGGPSDEELEKADKKKIKERENMIKGEPDIMGEHLKNKYKGYVDLSHFLNDYPEVKDDPKKLEEAQEYYRNLKE